MGEKRKVYIVAFRGCPLAVCATLKAAREFVKAHPCRQELQIQCWGVIGGKRDGR